MTFESEVVIYGAKTGGRQADTPNKRTQELLDQIQARWPEYHPVLAMVELAHDPQLPVEMRFQAHKEVAHYVEPKRKAVDVSAEVGLSHEAALALIEKELGLL